MESGLRVSAGCSVGCERGVRHSGTLASIGLCLGGVFWCPRFVGTRGVYG